MINFRKACIDDLESVLEIYNDAIAKFEFEKTFQWKQIIILNLKKFFS